MIIAFVLTRKPVRLPAYPLNPTHGKIAVAYRKYQKNVYDYYLVKKMNRALKKIIVSAMDKKWIKGEKYTVMS